jgi:hypothetical protein
VTLRIAILTPDPEDEAFHSRWRGPVAQNAAPLERAGMAVEQRGWVEPIRPGEFDLVLPLLTWGYHRAGARWHAAVASWRATGVAVQNPPEVLHWNSDKTYLGRLAGRGAPVVPTLYADRLTPERMEEAAAALGADRLVAKPQISASAWQTIRWSPGAPLDGGPEGPAMIQPYLPAIETEGELSLIYFDRRYSHAIRKRPGGHDFFVQPEHGGIVTDHEPSADEHDAAAAILAAVDEPLLYARVDLARGLDGAPALMELELVEPDLYLERDPRRGAAFAAAVARAAG